MRNYYLEDRPTSIKELEKQGICSRSTLIKELKTAEEMGAIEIDQLNDDRRNHVVYPTRGLVADTDNLFSRNADDQEQVGIFIYFKRALTKAFFKDEKQASDAEYEEGGLTLTAYQQHFDNYQAMIIQHLPDTDRKY